MLKGCFDIDFTFYKSECEQAQYVKRHLHDLIHIVDFLSKVDLKKSNLTSHKHRAYILYDPIHAPCLSGMIAQCIMGGW